MFGVNLWFIRKFRNNIVFNGEMKEAHVWKKQILNYVADIYFAEMQGG